VERFRPECGRLGVHSAAFKFKGVCILEQGAFVTGTGILHEMEQDLRCDTNGARSSFLDLCIEWNEE
jgi:hypothetical protein